MRPLLINAQFKKLDTGPQQVHFAYYAQVTRANSFPQKNCYHFSLHQFVKFRDLLQAHTHTHPFDGPFSGWASTRKVKSIWILLKQETVSGSGISWAICKSAPCSRQITTPAPHQSFFYSIKALKETYCRKIIKILCITRTWHPEQ